MLKTAQRFLWSFTDLFFPNRCLGCGKLHEDDFCPDCFQKSKLITQTICPYCGTPNPSGEAGLLCTECRKEKPEYLFCRSALHYAGPIREALHHLKYYRRTKIAVPLVRLLLQYLENCPEIKYLTVDRILPVPLSRQRARWRTFNQAEILAQALSKRLEIPLRTDILIRKEDRLGQFKLNRKSRKENISGVFSVASTRDLDGKSVLLVDDIYTTGATIKECTRVLKKAGARKIVAVTLARSVIKER